MEKFLQSGNELLFLSGGKTACPIGAMQAVNGSIDFKTSFYVWGMILAFGVVLGRAVCGFLCPFGLIQELLYKIPFPKKKLWKGFTWIHIHRADMRTFTTMYTFSHIHIHKKKADFIQKSIDCSQRTHHFAEKSADTQTSNQCDHQDYHFHGK